MLEKIKESTETLISDEKEFRDFYGKGYKTYAGEDGSKGEVSIAEDKGVLAYIQDETGTRRIAFANLKDRGIIILQSQGNNYAQKEIAGKENTTNAEVGGFFAAQMYVVSQENLRRKMNFLARECQRIREKENRGVSLSEEETKEMLENILEELNKVNGIAKEVAESKSADDDISLG